MTSLEGRILFGTGGLYSVLLDDGKIIRCRARGVFRIKSITPLAGDRVSVRYGDGNEKGYFIESISERKSELVRPPVANIDTVFAALCPSEPEPNLLYTDKLLSFASYAGITPVVVITKSDVSKNQALALAEIYSAGYKVFMTSSACGEGLSELASYIKNHTDICAFAGASGVGKSTLLNTLFPDLALKTGVISEKSRRGKHTTRTVSLFIREDGKFVADTPGFTMLDFDSFDFFPPEQLFYTFPEFQKYFAKCKYRGCTHTKEEGCEILGAVSRGEIPPSRHENYVRMYSDLLLFEKKNRPKKS